MCEGCGSQKTAMGDRFFLGIQLSHLASPLPPPWIPDPPASISQELGSQVCTSCGDFPFQLLLGIFDTGPCGLAWPEACNGPSASASQVQRPQNH